MAVRLWAKGQARKKADPEGEEGVRGLAVRPVLTVSEAVSAPGCRF